MPRGRSTPADLARALKHTPSPNSSTTRGAPGFRRTTGVVWSVQSGPPPTVTCTIAGDDQTMISGIRHADSYVPQVHDVVFVDVNGHDHTVAYKLSDALPTTWVNFALQNSWVSFGAPFTAAPGYRVEGPATAPVIRLRGAIKLGTAPTFATLPVGLRPVSFQGLSTLNWGGGVAVIEVSNATGVITAQYAGTLAWIPLDGITFPLT